MMPLLGLESHRFTFPKPGSRHLSAKLFQARLANLDLEWRVTSFLAWQSWKTNKISRLLLGKCLTGVHPHHRLEGLSIICVSRSFQSYAIHADEVQIASKATRTTQRINTDSIHGRKTPPSPPPPAYLQPQIMRTVVNPKSRRPRFPSLDVL